MALTSESRAVDAARAHIQAWSTHDQDTARKSLADDVHVTVTTTQPIMKPTDTVGVEEYMTGLTQFTSTVVPGSAREIAAIGDERNALVMLTVEADLGGGPVTLPAARLYLFDDDDRIKVEQVVFFAGL
jgi:hypothetical protein